MKARQIADQYLNKVPDKGYHVSAADVLKRSESGIIIVMIVEARRASAIQYSIAGLINIKTVFGFSYFLHHFFITLILNLQQP